MVKHHLPQGHGDDRREDYEEIRHNKCDEDRIFQQSRLRGGDSSRSQKSKSSSPIWDSPVVTGEYPALQLMPFDKKPFRLLPKADDMLERVVATNKDDGARIRESFEAVRGLGLYLALRTAIRWGELQDMLKNWGYNETNAQKIATREVSRKRLLVELWADKGDSMPADEAEAVFEVLDDLVAKNVVLDDERRAFRARMAGIHCSLKLDKLMPAVCPWSADFNTSDPFGYIARWDEGVNENASIDDADGDWYGFLGSCVMKLGWWPPPA
ncbi:hypothetical protein OQA88_4699 [Cercophora sp. LCS_1]